MCLVSLILGCAGVQTTELDRILTYGNQYANRAAPRPVLAYLIEKLGHDDTAVRMMAIVALEKITDRRMGFDPYGHHGERTASIERWVRTLEQGELGRGSEAATGTARTEDRPDGSR